MLKIPSLVIPPLSAPKNLIEDIIVEIHKPPPKPEGEKGVKLGDVEGIKARLDKRLGSDDLLKVIILLWMPLTFRVFTDFFTNDPEPRMKLRRISESFQDSNLLIMWAFFFPVFDIRNHGKQCTIRSIS